MSADLLPADLLPGELVPASVMRRPVCKGGSAARGLSVRAACLPRRLFGRGGMVSQGLTAVGETAELIRGLGGPAPATAGAGHFSGLAPA